jgi:predicted ATPase/DNA-binding XRE family transcriptional regulator
MPKDDGSQQTDFSGNRTWFDTAKRGFARSPGKTFGVPVFGDLLRQYRVAAGLSQEDLAERAGLSPNGVSALERGVRQRAYRGTVCALADALGLSADLDREFHAAAREPSNRIQPNGNPPSTNLILQRTALIGRATEIAEIHSAIASRHCVTITGVGGVGKTRVAREAAVHFMKVRNRDAWFIDLASINDATAVPQTIASVIGARRQCGDSKSLVSWLRSRELLVVLDNCEHLISGIAPLVADILRDCSAVSIVCTSRERLHQPNEIVYHLEPLAIPPNRMLTAKAIQEFSAVILFLERMATADPHYTPTPDRTAIAADICRRLDGIPLAIELAAARAPALGIGILRDRLQEHMFFSADDVTVPERQRTMSATISWSVNLLDNRERSLLRSLTAFAGSFTMEAVEAVCRSETTGPSVADTLARLIHKSLVAIVPDDEPRRYRLLESVRSYARDQATRQQRKELRARHARWIADIAEHAHAVRNSIPGDALVQRLLPTLNDTRVALNWALGDECLDVTLAARIVGGMRIVWLYTGYREECRRFGLAALEHIDELRHPEVASRLLLALFQSTHGAEMRKIIARATPVFKRLGDRRSIAATQSHLVFEYARYGDLAGAEAAAQTAEPMVRALEGERSRLYANFLSVRGFLRVRQKRYDECWTDICEARRINEDLGEFLQVLMNEIDLSEIEYLRGDSEAALQRLIEARHKPAFDAHADALDAPEANLRLLKGDVVVAARLAAMSLEAALDCDSSQVAYAIQTLAGVAAVSGMPREATRLLGFADNWFDKEHFSRDPIVHVARTFIAATIARQLPAETTATILDAAGRAREGDIVGEAFAIEARCSPQ